MDDYNHYYNYLQKIRQTNEEIGQHNYLQKIMQTNEESSLHLQDTFVPTEHAWFANPENPVHLPPSEEEQQMDVESLPFSSATTLLPSPADLDITLPANSLET